MQPVLAKTLLPALAILGLSGCGTSLSDDPPPRSDAPIHISPKLSEIAVPVSISLTDLSRTLEQEIPRELWAIDKAGQVCLAPKKIDVLRVKLKSPKIKCRIVGKATRGPMRLSGSGRTLIVTMPIHAVVRAKDIGGILSQETAEADATVRAIVHLDMQQDWRPTATVDIAYDWTREPSVEFLGQRITLTSKADARLQKVVRKLERTLPQELAKLHVRDRVQSAWQGAFTSFELNHAAPPVWMRVRPKTVRYGGYQVKESALEMRLALSAQTETFIGKRPDDPQPSPLPPLQRMEKPGGQLLFNIPVIADYAQLEPVVQRALVKRARRPFDIPGIGPVRAKFGRVQIYGTSHGRIAVGSHFSAQAVEDSGERASGTLWLTAFPTNQANSRQLRFTDLEIDGITDHVGTDLLLKLANAPGLSSTIGDALTQNFADDYADLLAKIGQAIDSKRTGPVIIRAQINDVRTGQLEATGRGLYLPVEARGSAQLLVKPE